MKTPEIWQLGMHFDPAQGGADRYFHDLLRGLEQNGRYFTAAAFDGNTDGNRVSLGPSAAPLLQRRSAIRNFGKRIAASPTPKVAAAHFALYAGFLAPVMKATPLVVHFHGPWSGEAAAEGAGAWTVFAKGWIEKRVYSRAAHCIVLSKAFQEILTGGFGISPEKISVVPGPVDLEKFRPPESVEVCRERLGRPAGRRMVFCVRRLVSRMGIPELIEGFSKIAGRFPDVDLVIGGSGERDADFRAAADRTGLGERIAFRGFIPEAELPSFYGAADFSVVPSQRLEGFGLVALESLACGTPVVVTPVGGLPETVAGLSKHLVLPDPGPDAIANGLGAALETPGFLPGSLECRKYAEINFSPSRIAGRIAEIYDRMAAK
ncbi:MAG: glycosyltransferase family 1 protein [Verrucomicrobiaceae bacterium]|nr:MAG: glycosyltransferase family 1 protein [Verrucomicrobiaceae bacterium]